MALELKDKTSNLNDFTTNSGVTEATDAPASLTGAVYSADVTGGGGDYLEALDSPSLSMTGDHTIEFWAKSSSTDGTWGMNKFVDTGNQRSYSIYGDSAEGIQWVGSSDGNYPGGGGGNGRSANSKVLTDGAWHHYAVIYTASSGTLAAYIDASVVTGGWTLTTMPTSIFNSTAPFKLTTAGSGDVRYCDIRVWNTARSSTDISNNYQSFLIGNESGLAANWTFQPFSRGSADFLRFL